MSKLYSDVDADTLRKLVIRRDEEIVKLRKVVYKLTNIKTNPLDDPRFKDMIKNLWANQDGASMEIVCDYYGDSVSEYINELRTCWKERNKQ